MMYYSVVIFALKVVALINVVLRLAAPTNCHVLLVPGAVVRPRRVVGLRRGQELLRRPKWPRVRATQSRNLILRCLYSDV